MIRFWFWLLLLLAASGVLCTLPLTNNLGFEFSFIIGIILGLASGHLSLGMVHRHRLSCRHLTRGQAVLGLFSRALSLNLVLFGLPLLIITIAQFWTMNCDWLEGLGFYFLLPGITLIYASALGLLIGYAIPYRIIGDIVYFLSLGASIGLSLYKLYMEPPIFSFNPIFGYVPGWIYDELIEITGTLVLYRVFNLLYALLFLFIAYLAFNPSKGRLDLFRLKLKSAGTAILLLLISTITLFHLLGAHIGFDLNREDIINKLGGRFESRHFVIYYPKKSKIHKRIKKIAEDHEFRYWQLTRYFKITPKGKFHSYYYSSPKEKARLMGARYLNIAKPYLRELHIHDAPYPHSVLKHELAHLLAGEFGAPPFKASGGLLSMKPGLIEGLAVAAAWDEDRLTAHQWSKAYRLLKKSHPPSMEKIIDAGGFWTSASGIAYTLSGSFVRFLIDRYGIEKFKRVYPDAKFNRTYGKSLKALVGEWEKFLAAQIPLSRGDRHIAKYRFRRPSIFKRVCAHELAQLHKDAFAAERRKDHQKALILRKRIISFEPRNTSHHAALLNTVYQAKNYHHAAKLALKLLDNSALHVPLRARVLGIGGNALWRLGRKREARNLFERALALHPSYGSDRLNIIKLKVLALPASGENLRQYLLQRRDSRLELLILKEATMQNPEFASAFYLLGRRLFYFEKWKKALQYLTVADKLKLKEKTLLLENWRLIGEAHYHLGRYNRASVIFKRLIKNGLSQGNIVDAQDWLERCRWALQGKP